MVDTGTGLTLLAPSAVMLKVLGPTAEYVGSGIQQWTQRRVENVNNVFAKAADRLGEEGMEEPGSVHPKVLKGILDEAPFCDDELSAEYLGGVLASARSEISRDDRAATLVALVARLSTYQLRSHYVMYAAAQKLLSQSELNLGDYKARRDQAAFFLPAFVWEPAMEFTDEEVDSDEFQSIVDHVVYGLGREDLIDDGFTATGSAEYLSEHFEREFPDNGIVFCVSMLGMELFTAVHGVRGRPAESFLGDHRVFEDNRPLALVDGVVPLSALPAT